MTCISITAVIPMRMCVCVCVNASPPVPSLRTLRGAVKSNELCESIACKALPLSVDVAAAVAAVVDVAAVAVAVNVAAAAAVTRDVRG